MNTLKFYLDFGGFYDSHLSAQIDYTLEDEIEYQKEEHGREVDPCITNYQELREKLSKEYITALNETLFYETELRDEPSLEYISLNSPRFYNFETDTILTQISIKDLKNLFRLVDRSKLVDYINEASKSRDGFISFYNGFEAVKKDLSIFCRYFFNYLFEVYEIDQSTVINTGYFYETITNLTHEHINYESGAK
jgi:hypothetical protein